MVILSSMASELGKSLSRLRPFLFRSLHWVETVAENGKPPRAESLIVYPSRLAAVHAVAAPEQGESVARWRRREKCCCIAGRRTLPEKLVQLVQHEQETSAEGGAPVPPLQQQPA